MGRLGCVLIACAASLGMQAALARFVPLPPPVRFIARLIDGKIAHAEAITGPKLVILAGSNGAFSHRCETMQAVLALPCANASVAVGIGLDYLFARWRPLLHPGDVVYMPMEPVQYSRSWTANLIGPESRLLLHGDSPDIGRQLPLSRRLAEIFAIDLPTVLNDTVTWAMLHAAPIDTAHDADYDDAGDRIGHISALAPGAAGALDDAVPEAPRAADIRTGHGAALIGGFVRWAGAHGVTVIGGLSTGFDDIALPQGDIDAQAAVFTGNGGRFLILPYRSRYPRRAFFDTPYHLNEACQIRQSLAVADQLAPMIGRLAQAAPEWATRADCPIGAEHR